MNSILIGDLILDNYVFGDVKRISPEAPVPILNVLETEERLIDSVSVMSFLLKKKCLEMEQIKKQEIRNKIERGEFESSF